MACTFHSSFELAEFVTAFLTRRLIIYRNLCIASCVHVLRKFAKQYSSLFRKHGVSMKRHIWEGICIPRHDLKRNVTARGRGQCAVQRYKQT